MRIGQWETHPVADVYPLMEGEEYARFVASIRASGLHEPIWILRDGADARVLDGRNRLRACLEVEVAPRFVDYEGETDVASLLDFVRCRNLARRHLRPGQLALIAARSVELFEQAAKQRMRKGAATGGTAKGQENLPDPCAGQSRDLAASQYGVSGRSVDFARAVLRAGANELIHAVETGDVAVSAAAELAVLAAPDQRVLLDRAKGKPHKLRSLLERHRTEAAGSKDPTMPGAAPGARSGVRDGRSAEVPPALANAFRVLQLAYREGVAQIDVGRRRILDAQRQSIAEAPPGLRPKLERHFAGQQVRLRALAEQARLIVQLYEPYLVCEGCSGEGCDECREIGWLTREVLADEPPTDDAEVAVH